MQLLGSIHEMKQKLNKLNVSRVHIEYLENHAI